MKLSPRKILWAGLGVAVVGFIAAMLVGGLSLGRWLREHMVPIEGDFVAQPDGSIEIAGMPLDDVVRILSALSNRSMQRLEHLPEDRISIRVENRGYWDTLEIIARYKNFGWSQSGTEFRILDPHAPFQLPEEMLRIGEFSALDIPIFMSSDEPFGNLAVTEESRLLGDCLTQFLVEISSRVPPQMEPVRILLDSRAHVRSPEFGDVGAWDTAFRTAESFARRAELSLERDGNTLIFMDILDPAVRGRPAEALEINFRRTSSGKPKLLELRNVSARELLNLIGAFSDQPVEITGELPAHRLDFTSERDSWDQIFAEAATALGATNSQNVAGRYEISFPVREPLGPILELPLVGPAGRACFQGNKGNAQSRLIHQLEEFRQHVSQLRPDLPPPVIFIDTRLSRAPATVLPAGQESPVLVSALMILQELAVSQALDLEHTGDTVIIRPRETENKSVRGLQP